MGCGHDGCGACCGGSCGGCDGSLELTELELELLGQFAQTPFLPVARRWDSETPVYLADQKEYGNAILLLQQKRLIRLDYDIPLLHFDYKGYEAYPCQGSMALTARGQEILELLEVHGLAE